MCSLWPQDPPTLGFKGEHLRPSKYVCTATESLLGNNRIPVAIVTGSRLGFPYTNLVWFSSDERVKIKHLTRTVREYTILECVVYLFTYLL